MIFIYSFVVRMIWRINKCPDCIAALEATHMDQSSNVYSLVSFKNNGGLIYPSPSIMKICKEVGSQFTLLEAGKTFLQPERDYLSKRVTIPVVNRLIESAS